MVAGWPHPLLRASERGVSALLAIPPLREHLAPKLARLPFLAAMVDRGLLSHEMVEQNFVRVVAEQLPTRYRATARFLVRDTLSDELRRYRALAWQAEYRVKKAIAVLIAERAPSAAILRAARAAVPAWDGCDDPDLQPMTEVEMLDVMKREMAWSLRSARFRRR